MSDEPVHIRAKRQRRTEGKNWSTDDEEWWQKRFPSAEPEPWMDGDDRFAIPTSQFDPADIPELDSEDFKKTPGDLAVEGISVIDAYVRWCGKMQPKEGKKSEGIKISCPIPGHTDKNPSAWCNTDNNTWFCGACQEGGDQYDIAAFRFGYDRDYKHDKQAFRALKMEMANDLGYTIIKTPSGKTIQVEPDPVSDAPDAEPESQIEPTPAKPILSIVPEPASEADEDLHELAASKQINEEDAFIDWESLIPTDSFLHEWMSATSINDSPDEYLFWLGLQGLGAAAGRDVYMTDIKPVRGNLFVCIYGPSGNKKSLATSPFIDLIREALPYDRDATILSNGVDLLGDVGSTEYFMESLSQKIKDPSAGTETNHPKRSLWELNELSSLFARTAKSSTGLLKEKLMEAFDCYRPSMVYDSKQWHIEVKEPYFQALSTTQPNAIRAYMDRADIFSGFLNRWVFAYGQPRRAAVSHGGFAPDIEQSTDILRSLNAWCAPGHVMNMNRGTPQFKAWDDFFHKTLHPFRSHSTDDIYKRIDLILKKIIVLFCVNERQKQPTAEIVEKATSLFPYLQTTYALFSKAVTANDAEDCTQAIIEYLKVQESATIFKMIETLNNQFSYDLLGKCFQNLDRLGVVELDSALTKKKGVPTYKLTSRS